MSKIKSLVTGTTAVVLTFLSVQAAFAYQDFDRRIVVTNNSSMTLMKFHGTNTGIDDFGDDLLPYPLRPGKSIIIDLDDSTGYCLFDVKGVFRNGSEVVDWRLNACEVTELSYEN